MNIFKKKKGFSIIELLLVVIFVVIGTIIAFATYRHADSSAKVKIASQQLADLAQNIRNASSVAKDLSQYSTPNIIADHIYPNSITPDPTNKYLQGPWGAVVVNSASVGLSSSDRVYIGFSGMSNDECIKLTTENAAAFCRIDIDTNCTNLDQGQCNAGTVTTVKDCAVADTVPDVGTVTQACNQPGLLSVGFALIKNK